VKSPPERITTLRARLAFTRELAAAALSSLEIDPERSILLALQAVATTQGFDGTVLPEAQEALHRSLLSSQVRRTSAGTRPMFTVDYTSGWERILPALRAMERSLSGVTTGEEAAAPAWLNRNPG
jgi:hypothetical protein